MSKVLSKNTLYKMLDHLRNELTGQNIAVAMAALIYLRWADFQEAEQEAIAAFDDTDYQPVLPNSMRWRSWHILHPQELQCLLLTVFRKH